MNYPLNYDDSDDEKLALVVTLIIGIILSVGGYFVYKSLTKNEKQKIEQYQKNIQYSNVKQGDTYYYPGVVIHVKYEQKVR